jgi:EAL domain-containing protein (putative c-di-GMP-specific phosphodiesterase class I)
VIVDIGQNERQAAETAERVADKILAVLTQAYRLGTIEHHSSASLGVTLFRGDGIASEDLIKQADLAMYKSKEAGRHAVRFFDPDMETAINARSMLEKELNEAWSAREFELYYQPQIDSAGAVEGAEALMRWRHPRRGLVMPGEFIPLAEDTGLILLLGQWAIDQACTQLAEWARRPSMRHFKIAVNVSAKQFHQADFVEKVRSALRRAGVDAGRLVLELTESVLVRDVQDVIDKMGQLKKAGVGFALDDFGTGYSSLAYLKRLPLEQLKIDRSFVRDVLVDDNDASIAKMIVALAHSLDLEVIAEGVETIGQRDFLAGLGCQHFQGYLYSPALAIEDFESLVFEDRAAA